MQNLKSSFILGIILVVIGGVLLLKSLDIVYLNWDSIGSLVLIFFGAYHLGSWVINRKNQGLLFTGTLMFIYGILFLFCSWYTWNLISNYWPVLIIAPGLGFLFMYLLGNKDMGVLITSLILLGTGVIFLLRNFYYYNFWPVIIIVIGLLLIWKGRRDKKDDEESGDFSGTEN